jgi:ABC-type amino acid transport substrate-binding protein
MKALFLSILLTLITLPAYADEIESTFDRVISSHTIQCGYTIWSPLLSHNSDNNSYSGIAFDIMQEVKSRTGLNINWTEEASVDVILQGLQTNRYDMVCFPLYVLGTRARVASFSVPLYYMPIYLVVRKDDKRFDNNINIINTPEVKLAVLEGEATALLGPRRFPKSTLHAVPQVQGFGFVLKDVAIGKADVTISDITSVDDFNKNNTEKLRILGTPFVVNPVAFPLPQDFKMKSLIDSAIIEIQSDGWLENLLKTKYPDFYKQIVMPAPAYNNK